MPTPLVSKQVKKRLKPMKTRSSSEPIFALVANPAGEIFELEGFAAVGMSGPVYTVLGTQNTLSMPYGSELMYLPDRQPVVFNLSSGAFEILDGNPYAPDEPVFPVAAFTSPGYVLRHAGAYAEQERAGFLPLFAYGAVGWCPQGFRSAVIRVDRERRQDLRLMPPEKVRAGIDIMKQNLPRNRLRAHLENCALQYACPAAKNFFIGRCEAPLPTSRKCNARCLGCLSMAHHRSGIAASQHRIGFTPTPEEIAEVALAHIRRVPGGVVSFGQGCEGDPLLASDVIERAVCLIRKTTARGTINMNTNAGRPDALARLFEAGLDSIRVSLNSARRACYDAYFRPLDYEMADVITSIDVANGRGKHVALNYLNCPGVTDTEEELEALTDLMRRHPIHLIQWRNLNFDPLRYWQLMNQAAPQSAPLGMDVLLETLAQRFPGLAYGYFNPPKERFFQENPINGR